MPVDYDVIVVGGGGAGLAAAWHAAEAGTSVLVIEAADALGGAMAVSAGVIYAAGTSVQEAAGIADTADEMYYYMMALNQWSIKPVMARIMADGGESLVTWLTELGNEFPPDSLIRSGADSIPRGHQSITGGAGIVVSLTDAVEAMGVRIVLGSRVSGLIINDGSVEGVRTADAEFHSRAVILTTGGFLNNREMVERMWPTAAAIGSRAYSAYQDVPFSEGDGIVLGESAGARLAGRDTGLLNPSTNFGRFVEPFLPEWAMIVNRDGSRFLPEDASYSISGYLINEQPEMKCFAIFDEVALMEACADGSDAAHYLNDLAVRSWRVDTVRKNVAEGRVKTADSIAELARRSDISPRALARTVNRYNQYADAGQDGEFFKRAEKIYPIRTAPFYAVEIRASTLAGSHAGLEIDQHGHVLNRDENIIPGLYAGGDVVGGTLGRRYIGGGIGIANALTFGRLAGLSAVRDVLRKQKIEA